MFQLYVTLRKDRSWITLALNYVGHSIITYMYETKYRMTRLLDEVAQKNVWVRVTVRVYRYSAYFLDCLRN